MNRSRRHALSGGHRSDSQCPQRTHGQGRGIGFRQPNIDKPADVIAKHLKLVDGLVGAAVP